MKRIVCLLSFLGCFFLYGSTELTLTPSTKVKRSLGYLLYTNESTTPLQAEQIYNSGPINIAEYSMFTVFLKGSPANAKGTMYVEFSPDTVHWDRSIEIPIDNLSNEPPHTFTPISVYCRIRYINGSTNQDEFRLQGVFHRNTSKGLTSRLQQTINDTTDVENVRAVLVGKNQSGNYENVLITSENALAVDVKGSSSAFGEVAVSEPTTISQIQFTYDIHPALITSFAHNQGTVGSEYNMLKVSSGASQNSYGMALSTVPIKYNPGQGAFCRFSGVFTQGVTGSTQYIGVGDESNGFFFGYKDNQFGITRREAGSPEVRILTLTQKASSNQTIQITLDGSIKNVAVTSVDDVTQTANEIAAADYSNTGSGWTARARGNQVTFIAWNATPRTGTYSLVGTANPSNARPAGTFARAIAGLSPREHFIPQSSWNIDKFDGTGKSGIILDPTKGNVYQIRWQWLGFGVISYSIENPDNGTLERVHIEHFPNSSLETSVSNPNLNLHFSATNTTNTTEVTVHSGSIAGLVDGKEIPFGVRAGISGSKSVRNAEVPILTLRNRDLVSGKINKGLAKINIISYGSAHSQPVEVRFYANPTLVRSSFSNISPFSTMEYDTSATSASGGTYLSSVFINPNSGSTLVLTSDPTAATLPPGGYFTATARSIGSNSPGNVYVGFNFIELK